MPEEWLSVAQAAAAMKVHPRTIERRMVANKIEFRKNEDGQVQVLVSLPDIEPVAEQVSSEAFETVKELANQQVDIAAGSASAIVRVAQEQAMRAENQLLLARQDAGRYRRESRFAVGLVAGILLLVIGASAVLDRRDVGPAGIVRAGGEIVHFGMPVDPGNLICVGRIKNIPALVLPGCARSPKLNGIDFILTRLFAGLKVTGADIMRMGVGGLLKEFDNRPLPREKAPATPRMGAAPRSAPTIAALVLAAGRSRRS